MPYETELIGGFFHEYFYPLLYEYEALRQDCMPSGHTMITVLTVYLAWRHSKRHLLWLCPIAFFLILGTLVLRYHWFVDLLVAIPFVMLAIWLFPAPVSSASQSRGVGRASRR